MTDPKHKFVSGICVNCPSPEREAENEELRYTQIEDDDLNDEDLMAYKRFGVG